jgi:hypothetical protein
MIDCHELNEITYYNIHNTLRVCVCVCVYPQLKCLVSNKYQLLIYTFIPLEFIKLIIWITWKKYTAKDYRFRWECKGKKIYIYWIQILEL